MWKNKEHTFRKDPELQLQGIPTLIHWTRQGMGQQVSAELEGAKSAEEADAMISNFIQKTS